MAFPMKYRGSSLNCPLNQLTSQVFLTSHSGYPFDFINPGDLSGDGPGWRLDINTSIPLMLNTPIVRGGV